VAKALHNNTYAIEQNTLPAATYQAWKLRTEQAIAVWPGNPQAWSQLAQLAYYQYRISADDLLAQEAQKAGAMATHIVPGYWRYWVYYGLGLAASREWDRAGVAFQTALQLAPGQPDAWYYYAVFLNAHTPRSDQALQALERCLQLDPRYHPAASLKDRLTRL
jgi:tetratricopeptide (TPR) repeat protein